MRLPVERKRDFVKTVKNLQFLLANFKNAVIIWIVNNLQKKEILGERQRRKEDGKDSCSYGR